MNPRRLSARSYRTFEELDLDLPHGCVAIVGDNGAGKSSIVNLIELALFGGPLARYLTRGATDTELRIELELEHRDELYRVRRSYSARGRGQTKLDLEQWRHDLGPGEFDWLPLTAETARETQEHLETLLGLTRDTFRASAFVAQGDGAAFTEAEPRARKEILASVLGLHVWDRALETVKAEHARVEGQAQQLSVQIEMGQAELDARSATVSERDSARVLLEDARQRVAAVEESLGDLDRRAAEAREAKAQLGRSRELAAAKAAEISACERRLTELVAVDMEIQEQLADRDALAAAASQAEDLERALAGLRAQHAEHRERATERAAVEQDIRRLEQTSVRVIRDLENAQAAAARLCQEADEKEAEEQPRCQTCGQTIEGEAKTSAIEKLRDAARQHAADADSLGRESASYADELSEQRQRLASIPADPPTPLEPVERQLAEAQQAAVLLATLDERHATLGRILQDITDTEATLARLQDEYARARLDEEDHAARAADLERLEQQQAAARGALADLRTAAEGHAARAARCDAILERLQEIEKTVATAYETRSGLQDDLAVTGQLERAFGRDGIPALIVENAAIPAIETEANRILGELHTPYRVELRTQRALKTKDAVRETLDIVVYAPDGEALYEDFSGGEKTRLNLALRIALARLLAHRRGAEVRVLAIDEPEHLDEQGMDALAGVLRSLVGDFDRILLVSHHPALREAFDQVLHVVKDGERSAIVTDDQLELVDA